VKRALSLQEFQIWRLGEFTYCSTLCFEDWQWSPCIFNSSFWLRTLHVRGCWFASRQSAKRHGNNYLSFQM